MRSGMYLAVLCLFLVTQSHAQDAEAELQSGIALSSKGLFADAIPHLEAAAGNVRDEFAASFNLALCYVGVGRYEEAVSVLDKVRASGHNNADVSNLLAQSYVGIGQIPQARDAFRRGAALSPQSERLYVFVAQSCAAHQAYDFGLEVVGLGLKNLPGSARLHYERGVLLSGMDRSDEAGKDFEAVASLEPESDLAYLALAQSNLNAGNVPGAIQHARAGVQKGHEDYMLLAVLGEALLRSGVAPGESGFLEAKAALEKSVAKRSNYPSAQIGLGRVLLMENKLDEAIAHLEIGRSLEPSGPAAYASLITAYRRKGQAQKASGMIEQLARLNQARAQQIGAAEGDRRAGYGLPRAQPPDPSH